MIESALVFATIIVGVAVTDELVSLHRLLRARRKVRWDWIPLGVALLVLLNILMVWWSLAGAPRTEQMTLGGFLPIVVALIILFLLASAVLPDKVPHRGIDLRIYYHENGSYIWTLYSLALGWIMLFEMVMQQGDIRQVLSRSLVEFFILALMVSLIFVRKRWWHAIALLILFSGPVAWLSRTLTAGG